MVILTVQIKEELQIQMKLCVAVNFQKKESTWKC